MYYAIHAAIDNKQRKNRPRIAMRAGNIAAIIGQKTDRCSRDGDQMAYNIISHTTLLNVKIIYSNNAPNNR